MAMQQTALIVIDMPKTIRADRDVGYSWANPNAPQTAGRSLAAFRVAGLPVLRIHHNASDPADGFHPDNPLCVPMPKVAAAVGEPVIVRIASSGFTGTALEATLHYAGIRSLVIVGGETNMCVESTARMAGNLGFTTTVVADAPVNFQCTLRDESVMAPQAVRKMSLANLTSSARIADSGEVLSELTQHP